METVCSPKTHTVPPFDSISMELGIDDDFDNVEFEDQVEVDAETDPLNTSSGA